MDCADAPVHDYLRGAVPTRHESSSRPRQVHGQAVRQNCPRNHGLPFPASAPSTSILSKLPLVLERRGRPESTENDVFWASPRRIELELVLVLD
ncbi:11834_t:CDS:2, partial [Acaulospora colombiana]